MSLQDLQTLLFTRPSPLESRRGRLRVAGEPDPFVPSPLAVVPESTLEAEIILVQAPAAVGKSTMAKYLSSACNAPYLDLAEVAVSTGTLEALLSHVNTPTNPILDFHKSELPVIIDALDEGILRSGEVGMEEFLRSTGELLSDSRDCTSVPKLILFGRPESIEIAEVGLTDGCPDVSFGRASLDFFDNESARQVIHEYAIAYAKEGAAYSRNPEPVRMTVDAYFDAIEKALAISPGELWSDSRGRAFAGYAPVLAALGQILANENNFQVMANRLTSKGQTEAWGVIVEILNYLMDREQEKVCAPMRKLNIEVPDTAYDCTEQLRFLMQHICGRPIVLSDRVRLGGNDRSAYLTMVEQHISEHPFVRNGSPANAVTAASILADAILKDTLQGQQASFFQESARQPFLWRTLRRTISEREDASEQPIVDGLYVGAVLASYWTDPDQQSRGNVVIYPSEEEGLADVGIGSVSFATTDPIRLQSRLKDCHVYLPDATIELCSPANFTIQGGFCTLTCGQISVLTPRIQIDTTFWVEAETISSMDRYTVGQKDGAKVGVGGAIRDGYPWSTIEQSLASPYRGESVLGSLVEMCSRRLPGTLVLNPDLTVTDDMRVKWLARDFPTAFPKLVALLIQFGFATVDSMGASGSHKKRIRFNIAWADLVEAVGLDKDAEGDLGRFVVAARSQISD